MAEKYKKWRTIFVISIIVMLTIFIMIGPVQCRHYQENVASFFGISTARTELLELRKHLRLGQSKENVAELFSSKQWRHLTLKNESKKRIDMWLVETKYEIGGKNWLLWLQFNDETLSGIRFRYSDSWTHKPLKAPDDEISPDASSHPEFDIANIY